MSITFSCDNCYSQFTVDSRLAGRRARCRKCNRKMQVPDVSTGDAPDPMEIRRRSNSRHGHRSPQFSSPEPAAKGKRPISWLDAVNSQVGLKPVSIMSEPEMRHREEDSFDSSITSYKIPVPIEQRPVNVVMNKSKDLVNAGYMETIHSYKQFFKRFQYLFRRINEMSYGLSIICFIAAIVGAIMGKHSITVTGISAIVLLNIIGLAAGVSNLIALQFRGNPVKGILFLLPPVALYYLWTNSAKWRKPINRIMTPIVVLCAVIGAYLYIPWLNGNKASQDNWADRIEGAVETIRHDVGDSLSEAKEKANELKEKLPDDLKNMDLEQVKKKAGETVDDLKDKLQDTRRKISTPEKRDP